jgi:hypothetical protein
VSRPRLFVHHDGRRGEVLLCRPLVAAIAAHGTDVVVGTCRGDGELFAGLGPRVEVREARLANTPWGAPVSLSHLADRGAPVVGLWAGGADRIPTNQWADLVASFQVACRRAGVDVPLGDTEAVPMLDFASPQTAVRPLPARSLYLDLQRSIEPACGFDFDVIRLRRALPEHTLLVTTSLASTSDAGVAGVVDVSAWTWAQRSLASERCELLVGCTLDPFVLTLTTANRHKPKALCGYDARVVAPFWDYPGNPMELLASMDELVDFCVANARVAAPLATAEVGA